MDELSLIQKIAVMVLPVLFAITVHEAAHGWAAKRLGDTTASMLGRVTFNPLRHIDPIGTVLIPLATYLLSGFLFGWAKPVPVNIRNLRNPRRDMALVAAAGPIANLLMGLFWALILRIGAELGADAPWFARPMIYMGSVGVLINAILMVLNLLPILPLDGGRVLYSLLPPKLSDSYGRSEPWGLVIILALLFTGVLGALVEPGIKGVIGMSYWLMGLD